MDLKIRTIKFIVDKGTKFHIDVHSHVNILALKKIIAAAANLNRKTLTLVHNDIDYRDREESEIHDLFPTLKEIVFNVGKRPESKDSHNKSSLDKVFIGKKCGRHEGIPNVKNLTLYCFTCAQSICTLCTEEYDHNGHDITEKLDFFTDSEIIVNDIFREINLELRNLNLEKFDEIDKLKDLINRTYFPNLHDLLDKIKIEMIRYLEMYEANLKMAKANFNENVNSLESNCVEGLDELKNKLSIKEILIDERVFLTLNAKLTDIKNEQEKLMKDREIYYELVKKITDFSQEANKIYKDLERKLKASCELEEFQRLVNEARKNRVNKINKEEILSHILETNESSKNSIKNVRRSIFPSNLHGPNSNDNTKNQQSFRLPSPVKNLPEIKREKPESARKERILVDSTQNNMPTQAYSNYAAPKASIFSPQKKTYHNTQDVKSEYDTEMNNSQDNSYLQDNFSSTMHEIIPPILDSSKKKIRPNEVLIMRAFPENNSVAVYNNITNNVNKIQVAFNPIMGIDKFPMNCNWLNHNNKLYITGGLTLEGDVLNPCRHALMYDPQSNTIKKLQDLIFSRYNHSSIAQDNYIYLVGGTKENRCERYDIKEKNWKKLPSLTTPERQTPILYIHRNFLYAFFGYQIGSYIETIERINLKMMKKWEILPYKVNDIKLNLKIVAAGLIPSQDEDDVLYFVGGKTHIDGVEKIRRDSFSFNFNENTFYYSDFTLEDETFFHHSQLINISKGSWAEFNLNGDQLLKIQIGGEEDEKPDN